MTYDIAIVGGGIAGYAAALTAKNLGLSYLWLAVEPFGGKTRAAETVRNFPSFSGNGAAFAEALERQRERENVVCTPARVDGVYRAEELLLTAGGTEYRARTVVLCTGVDLRGAVEGEAEFIGRGVSYCAVCDGALYRGKAVAAVLSSPRFAEEAEYLAGFAREVHVFCEEKVSFRAENITVHSSLPVRVEGERRVGRIVTKDEAFCVDGVFFFRDATPPKALCGGLETDGAHIKAGRDMATNLAGVFAAGDVTGRPYQFAKAAGEGLVAAYSARDYLRKIK